MAELIQRMVIDHLHIIGDIFDRGPGPHRILDALMNYHSLDIQWGNHDVLWMGAAAGHPACVARRCTIIGPVASGCVDFIIDSTEGRFPLPGTESIPEGLFTTTISASSYIVSNDSCLLLITALSRRVVALSIHRRIGLHLPLQAG